MASVSAMLTELADHGFTDISTERMVAMLNDTIWDICSREPWPFLEKTATLTFDGSSPAPTNLPSDFKAATAVVNTATGSPLDPMRYDVMKRQYGDQLSDTGDPVVYYFVGNELRVWNVPGSSTTLSLDYIAQHPTLTASSVEADILIPAQHHRVIVLGALYKLYDMDDDFDIGGMFQQQYEDRLTKMRGDLWVKQYDRPDRIYTVDDYDIQFLG